jgi:hypothetical protein
VDGDGRPVDPKQAIFPIIKQLECGSFELIGTGFFITSNGIFVTARHVLEDVLDKDRKALLPIGMLQFMNNNTIYLREFSVGISHNSMDVAVGVARPMIHNITKEPYVNKILTLSGVRPKEKAHISTYAYPKTIIIRNDHQQELHFYPTYFEGSIEEYLPNGRDKLMLPGPCFRTSIFIHGGASGGPVFDDEGRVFGINSTGFMDDNISYVSRIIDIIGLKISDVILPNNPKPTSKTIKELVDLGYIIFKPKIR